MDIIFLQEIKVKVLLGVPEWERVAPQVVLLDIELAMPHGRAGISDDIADTIDYGQVVAGVRKMLAQKSFRLVEALAEAIAQFVLDEFASPWVKVRVAKPEILPDVKQLGVVIERGKKN